MATNTADPFASEFAFGGAVFMILFWVGNADFAHGLVSGDFMGLLLS
jgi:thiosulfate dehydrogenase [quinone] large subunit